MNELILDLQQRASQYSLRFLDQIFPVAQHIVEIGKTQRKNLALLKNDYPDAVVGQIEASDIHRLKQGVVDLVIADLFTLQRVQAESNLQNIKASLTDNSLLILPVLSHRITGEVSEDDVFLDNEELKPLLSGLKPLFVLCNEVPVKINNERVTLFVYYLSMNELFEDKTQLIKKIKFDAENALSDLLTEAKNFDEEDNKDEPAEKDSDLEEKESKECEPAELPESEVSENEAEPELSEQEVEKEEGVDQERIESEAKEASEQEPREHESVEREHEEDEEPAESESESPHQHIHYHAHIHEKHDSEHIEEHDEIKEDEEASHKHPHLHQDHGSDHAEVSHENHEPHSHEHDHDGGENKSIHHELARHAATMQAHHDSIKSLEERLSAHHDNTSSMLKLFSRLEKPEEKHALIKKIAAAHAEHSALLDHYKALHEAHHEAYKNFMTVYEKGLEDAVSFGDKIPELVPTHQARLQKQQALIESHEALLQQSSQFIPRPS